MKTFLFYDLETTGLNPAFDQILTFACIRTDLKLNEIDRQTITVQLRRDIVPSPRAFLTHGLTHEQLALGITEYEAALKIHRIFNTPDTISLGYNSLGFDDAFLRFTFYRNLLDPYTHQYGHGCYRMDILPIAVIYRVFHPQGLNWPVVDEKSSLKLELIARENNFVTSGRAHEAMNDVEAVIGLAQKFFEHRAIWEYSLDFFNKTRDEVRIKNIPPELHVQGRSFSVCIMMSSSFGSLANFMAPVVHIGQSLAYKNQSLWLRLDSEDILGLDEDLDMEQTFVIRKRPGDALIVLPPLERFWTRMPESMQKLTSDNMAKLQENPEKFFKFMDYHLAFKYPFIPEMDPDAALYQDGFFSTQEKRESRDFHRAIKPLVSRPSGHNLMSPEVLESDVLKNDLSNRDILSQIKSPRIRTLAGRILFRNFRVGNLDAGKSGGINLEGQTGPGNDSEYQLHLNRLRSSREDDGIIGYKNDIKLNQKNGLDELKAVEQEMEHPNPDQIKMLAWLKTYIENL